MLGKSKKPKNTRVDSLIGQRTEITGDLKFAGGLHIDGVVRGNISAEEDNSSVLTVSDRGTIEGQVSVPYVILNGVVIGDVRAVQHIELASNARVEGDVYYRLIEMAVGAEVNGKLVHLSEAEQTPLLRHDEGLEPAEQS